MSPHVRSSRVLMDAGCLAPACRMLRARMLDDFFVGDRMPIHGWMLDAVLVDAGCLCRGCQMPKFKKLWMLEKIVDAG